MSATTTVIKAGRALLGPDLRVTPDAVIAIGDETIAAAGSAADTHLDAVADVVDAGEVTVLPGFIDAHVHIGFASPADVLGRGVTTARDLGWPPELIWPLVEQSRSRSFDGPTLIAAGPMLTAPGGYPTRAAWAPPGTGRVVTGIEDARAAVAEVAARGAAVVKVALNGAAGPTLDADTLRTIVVAAEARELRVTAHITGLEELEKAVAAGVNELAHMLMSKEHIPDTLIARMIERDMTIVPTLSVRFGRDRTVAIANLKRWRAAGGRVVYGTDLGNSGPRPGIDRREVRAMAATGMSGLEIVAAATVESAAWLGLADVGCIEMGRRADLVAVAGDPTADPDVLTNVRMVWRGGRRIR